MFEKVNPAHPDKIADRIAGAIVDLAYTIEKNPRIAVEVMLGHGYCYVVIESSVKFKADDVCHLIERLAGPVTLHMLCVKQNPILAENQKGKFRCGDNGIFKGMPVTNEQKELTRNARIIYAIHPTDGKYIQDGQRMTICQSRMKDDELKDLFPNALINPLGEWNGGTYVDTGAVNRKLGSDMGDSITGGGLHGKDLSKADVSINIYAFLKAQKTGNPVELSCSIGDEYVDGRPYEEIVEIARDYIRSIGGFEKLAEWGLIR